LAWGSACQYRLTATEPARKLIHGYIDVFAYSDGHIELRVDGTSLEHVRFDERPFVDAGAIIENKRLGHAFEGGAAHSGAA